MNKTVVGPQSLIYPRPVWLVGANVDGKPNFLTIAAGGSANAEPPMVSLSIRHKQYTYKGIRQNLTFSINIPSTDQVKETDYCGIISGSNVDKVKVCQFTVFYGKLNNAPLIEQCPINLECKVVHIMDLGSHALIIGQVEETHISPGCLTDGKPDVDKIKPLIYDRDGGRQYLAFGKVIAKAFSIGQELKNRE